MSIRVCSIIYHLVQTRGPSRWRNKQRNRTIILTLNKNRESKKSFRIHYSSWKYLNHYNFSFGVPFRLSCSFL